MLVGKFQHGNHLVYLNDGRLALLDESVEPDLSHYFEVETSTPTDWHGISTIVPTKRTTRIVFLRNMSLVTWSKTQQGLHPTYVHRFEAFIQDVLLHDCLLFSNRFFWIVKAIADDKLHCNISASTGTRLYKACMNCIKLKSLSGNMEERRKTALLNWEISISMILESDDARALSRGFFEKLRNAVTFQSKEVYATFLRELYDACYQIHEPHSINDYPFFLYPTAPMQQRFYKDNEPEMETVVVEFADGSQASVGLNTVLGTPLFNCVNYAVRVHEIDGIKYSNLICKNSLEFRSEAISELRPRLYASQSKKPIFTRKEQALKYAETRNAKNTEPQAEPV